MGGLTILIIIFVSIVAAWLGLRAYGRSRRPAAEANGKSKTAERAEPWGVRIHAASRERACPQVQEILGKEYPLEGKPELPLANCANPHQCQCGYTKLFDRRQEDRRSGQDRRAAGLRFEPDKPPRRSGKDRRKKIDWY